MKNIHSLLSIGLCLLMPHSRCLANGKPSIAISPVIAQVNNPNRQAEAAKLEQEGVDLIGQGNYPAAMIRHQQALAIAKEIGDRSQQSRVLLNICITNSYQGHHNTALEICQQSLTIARETKHREDIANALLIIGIIYQKTDRHPQEIDYLNQALVEFRNLQDKDNELTILHHLGNAYRAIDRYPQALGSFQQGVKLSRITKNRSAEAKNLFGMGLIAQDKSEYSQALELFQQVETITRAIDDQADLGAVLINIGQSYTDLGDYPRSLTYFERAIEIFQAIGDRSQLGVAINNRGNTYFYLGKYLKSLKSYESALKIYREISNRGKEARTLSNIGSVYQSLGQYKLSLKYYQSSLEIIKVSGKKQDEGTALGNIGTIYYELEEYAEAENYFKQALAIHQSIGNREAESTTIDNLANNYYSLKQYPKALAYHRQALTIKRAIGDRSGESTVLNNIAGDYLIIGESAQALSAYQQAIAIARQIKSPDLEGLALTNRANVLYRLDRLPESEAQLRAAIAIWESLRVGLVDKDKISLYDRIKGSYDLLQKVLIKQNKSQAALEIAERGRARVLAELLASKIPTINSATSQKIRQAPNLSKIQQIARAQKATLVEYSIIDDRILIWVIKPTGQITFHQTKLPPKTTLKDLIIATRDGIGANRSARSKDDTPNPTGGDLKQLHKLLIAPIVKDLPKKPEDRVIILPQNELFLVPFAALQDTQDRYLIQQHTITIAPSIQVLALTESKSNRLRTTAPLVVGNPVMPSFNGTPLANLPGSEAEAKGIGTILQVAPLIGAQADKQKVVELMKTAPIVHLATHGLLDTIKGDIPGAIALTNGFLTSGEIFDMQLSADLVVLSACDTGRGDLTGEGVVGLSRSLAVAGVPSVIVSLWEVNDEATKALMEEFYRNLQVKKLPKAQALRQAMLTTMVDYPNPNFWAAFVLMGEGR